MADSIGYRFMRAGEETEVAALVQRVFDRFVGPGFPEEGRREFLNYVRPEMIRHRFEAGNVVLVATAGDEVVGMVETRDNNHLSLLFVAEPYLRRGIGRELFTRALRICRTREPALTGITVNSSPYAVPVYEKLGFRPTGPEREQNGIRHIPMILNLASPEFSGNSQ